MTLRLTLGIGLALLTGACTTYRPTAWPAEAAADRLGLEVCRRDGIEEPLLCGRETRPARPGEPDGHTIDIAFVVIPAKDGNPRNLAWTEHQGGPGRTVLSVARYFAAGGDLEHFRASRDVLLVDQRGVGESRAMLCAALTTPRVLRAYFAPKTVTACRNEMAAAGLLDTDYSTIAAVDDLDAIRQRLGYDRLDVGGWSYGSRYMLTYAHRHPDRVRTLSVFVPTTFDYERPIDWARFTQASLEALFNDCASQPACAAAYTDLRADWTKALERLRRDPPRVTFLNPYAAQSESATITAARFVEEVHVALLKVPGTRKLPGIIHRAAGGDFAPFLELAVPPDSSFVPLAEATYLSIVCPEETAFIDEAEAERLAAGTFIGMQFVDEFRMACEIWSLPPHPDYPLDARVSDIPILIVAGGRDPITPIEYGEAIARNFSRSTVLAIEHMPHHSTGLQGSAECLDRILFEFTTNGSMDGVDTACATALPAPAYEIIE